MHEVHWSRCINEATVMMGISPTRLQLALDGMPITSSRAHLDAIPMPTWDVGTPRVPPQPGARAPANADGAGRAARAHRRTSTGCAPANAHTAGRAAGLYRRASTCPRRAAGLYRRASTCPRPGLRPRLQMAIAHCAARAARLCRRACHARSLVWPLLPQIAYGHTCAPAAAAMPS